MDFYVDFWLFFCLSYSFKLLLRGSNIVSVDGLRSFISYYIAYCNINSSVSKMKCIYFNKIFQKNNYCFQNYEALVTVGLLLLLLYFFFFFYTKWTRYGFSFQVLVLSTSTDTTKLPFNQSQFPSSEHSGLLNLSSVLIVFLLQWDSSSGDIISACSL